LWFLIQVLVILSTLIVPSRCHAAQWHSGELALMALAWLGRARHISFSWSVVLGCAVEVCLEQIIGVVRCAVADWFEYSGMARHGSGGEVEEDGWGKEITGGVGLIYGRFDSFCLSQVNLSSAGYFNGAVNI
jgi:hypothetical protein